MVNQDRPVLLPATVPVREPRRYRVIDSTVQDFCQDYRGEKFHALLCDPPYHLTSITKRFGGTNSAPAKPMKSGDKAFSRLSHGFMSQTWDGGDTAFDPDTWSALAEHLYPGAFIMAFAGTRGYHRMACALEDAGLIIHPAIGWIFGSGFPKATRVPDERFDGHRYGLQSLKPAFEFIAVAQKPYEGRPVDCITGTGAGALWIDGGRIPGQPEATRFDPAKHKHDGYRMTATGEDIARNEVGGRWPANLALIHDPRCNGTCVPECPVQQLGEQSGTSESTGGWSGHTAAYGGGYQREYYGDATPGLGDSGTAARYFHNADWHHEVAEQLTNADPVRYEAKASTEERSRGLQDMPWQMVNDGRQTPIDNAYQRGETPRLNPHPTVKPIGLTEWLAKLLLPPATYGPRRLLVPFSGSGSEMIGAYLAGWEQIIGIEMTMEYAQISRARLSYYADPLRMMRMSAEPTPQFIQQEMFA